MQRPFVAHRSGPLTGRVRVPGDKSISHRALMLGALASGVTPFGAWSGGGAVPTTAGPGAWWGAKVPRRDGAFEVVGRGVGGLIQPSEPLDFGNSGTGCRLMMGVIAGHDVEARLIGDASL